MSPPEVWGPAVWRLFHVLSEKISDEAYHHIGGQLFYFISKICKFLPCPECSADASRFLAKIKMTNLKTKLDLKNTMYLFHNYVNIKKRKPLFNYGNINIYKNYRIMPIINNFFIHYNTKGNMKLLSDSFQRQFVINQFKTWVMTNIRAFLQQPVILQSPSVKESIELKIEDELINTDSIAELNDDTVPEPISVTVIEKAFPEPIVEEPIIEQPVIEEPVIEEPVIEEPLIEEPVTELILEEPIVEEPVIEEPVTEAILEESIVEEPVIEEPVPHHIVEEPVPQPMVEETEIIVGIDSKLIDNNNHDVNDIEQQ